MNADLRTFHELDEDGYDVKGYMEPELPDELGGEWLIPLCLSILIFFALIGALYMARGF